MEELRMTVKIVIEQVPLE
ncbi:hypothetical protein D910_10469 [Dendroctonus ponderosae]|uniref:Uncharacterized protein n=1 Tax=Dendroctonus ponderosae TaxID=77166 RepID=U4UJ98_DENPD|nr:hypothetical protein D910_10469 [Dendroctonus ponderosae]